MQYLAWHRILYWRQSLGGTLVRTPGGKMVLKKNSMKGFPDIAGLFGGQFFTIEVKTLNGQLSMEQQQWIDRIRQSGGWHCTARNLNDVVEFIKCMRKVVFKGL